MCFSESHVGRKKVVNVIGKAGSGKTSLAEHLRARYGFVTFRPSDVIRAYAKAHDIPLKSRLAYVDTHRQMLAEDPESITRPVIESSEERICIDGLRVLAHARAIRAACGLYTIHLDTPAHLNHQRFKRIRMDAERSGRDQAPHLDTLAAFLQDEAVDDHNADPREPNISAITAMADVTIDAFLPQAEVFLRADHSIENQLNLSPVTQTP